jgi:hypothetical protein
VFALENSSLVHTPALSLQCQHAKRRTAAAPIKFDSPGSPPVSFDRLPTESKYNPPLVQRLQTSSNLAMTKPFGNYELWPVQQFFTSRAEGKSKEATP